MIIIGTIKEAKGIPEIVDLVITMETNHISKEVFLEKGRETLLGTEKDSKDIIKGEDQVTNTSLMGLSVTKENLHLIEVEGEETQIGVTIHQAGTGGVTQPRI